MINMLADTAVFDVVKLLAAQAPAQVILECALSSSVNCLG